MIQLNRIIYELKSASDNFLFQKEFLNNFFNPRIDNALNSYRDHINNMQKVALEDYDFITERTDRFYQKKYQNLLKSYSNEIDILRSESISAVTKLDNEKQNAIQASSQLKSQILKFESDSQKEIDTYLQKFKSTVSKIEKDGEIKLKTEIENFKSKEQKFITESEKKQKKMTEDHFLLMEMIKSGYNQPKLNIQFFKSKIKEIKKCICSYKNNLKSLQTYALQQISVNKNKINQLIKEIIALLQKNKNDQNSIQKVIDSLNHEFNEIIRQLKINFDSIKQNYKIEIDQKMNELSKLKIQFQKELDDLKNGLSQNDFDDEIQISVLQKSLKESLKSLMDSFEKERCNSIQKVEELQNQIDSLINQHEETIKRLKNQLEDLIKKHKLEIIELQSFFDAEIKETKKNYENEINEMIQKMSTDSNKDLESEADARATIENLEHEKEQLFEIHQHQISEFDVNSSEIFNAIQKETTEKVEKLRGQIDSMLNGYEKSLNNQINETISDNQKKKEELLKNIQNQYENEMNLIRQSGYSKSEYDRLLKMFQDEHLRLLEQSKQMVPFVVSNDMFANMTLVINDLEKELQDHIIMVSSRKRCLNLEWQQKYDQINKKMENFQQKHQNCRARNQIIQSIKNQISKTIKTKEEKVQELNQILNCNTTKSTKIETFENEDDEIIHLKDELNVAIQNSDQSISEAIKISEKKKKEISNNFSIQIKLINEQIRNVVQLIQKQNLSFENQVNELNRLFDINKMNYKKSYEESVNYFLNVFDNMKRNFLETEHLLRTKLKEQTFENSRNFDFYRSTENEEHKKLTKTLNEKDEQNNEYLSSRKKIKDDLIIKINELRSKKDFLVRKSADPSHSENDRTEKLENHLKMITNQLNIALQDLVEYKNLYISQEKKINQNFNGMPEIGTFKKKKNCVNYDVI